MSTFVIESAPSSSGACKVIKAVSLVGSREGALPIGKNALMLLGGKITVKDVIIKQKGGIRDDQIIIPDGVNPKNLKEYNLYDLLGFGQLADSADTDSIKKAYQKAVLKYHPDKAQFKLSDGKEDRSVFLKIQEALNVLTNEQKRRAYDSQMPFDDSVPSEDKVKTKIAEKGPKRFFKLFDPVFKRNARFAAKKPVPEIGNLETPLPQVKKFYEYWIKFDSWRDFTGLDCEHKPDDAGSREEKRWMQKENERITKKKKENEMNRIINMVMLAQKYDPRLVAEKDAKKNAKEAEKNAKESSAKARADEDINMKAWSTKLDDEASASRNLSKADKEKLKKAQSNARNIMRKLFRISAEKIGDRSLGEYGLVSEADLEAICSHCNLEDLTVINALLGGADATKDPSLFVLKENELMEKLAVVKEYQNKDQEDEKIAKEIKKRESDLKNSANGGKRAEKELEPESYPTLIKAFQRYAAGTTNRWVLITNYVNHVLAFPDALLTQDEVMRGCYRAHN